MSACSDPTGCGTHTYQGYTQAKVDAVIQQLRANGCTVSGNNPWQVDTHQHGVTLCGSWDPATQVLSVTVTGKNFYVPCSTVWDKIDPLLQHVQDLGDADVSIRHPAPNALGLYLVNLLVSDGLPGAPVLHLQLMVNAPTGAVSGTARITQALYPPVDVVISGLSGHIFDTLVRDEPHRLVILKGDHVVCVQPPLLGCYLEHITVGLSVDGHWSGTGAFNYRGHWFSNCTVTVEH